MKKLLILMLVVGLASLANAAIVSIESNGSNAVLLIPHTGGVIQVDVVVDTAVNSGFQITIGESTTSASHATSAVGTLNAGYVTQVVGASVDTLTNWGGGAQRYVLIHRISGNPAVGTPVAANAVSYSFNLTVPSGNLLDTFTITGYAGTPTVGGPPAYSYLIDGSAPTSTTNLVVTLIPEPMTIVLLGLGGVLFSCRRKEGCA